MRSTVLLLLVFASVLFSHARQETSTKTRSETNARSAAQFSTNADQNVLQQFQQWAENYATVGSEKARLSAHGLSLAAERRRILARLIESNPAEALRQAVPLRLRGKLPPEVAALLEESISGRGDFLVLATLPVQGAEISIRPIERFVILGGRRYEAFVYGGWLTQATRTNVPIDGVAIDGKLAIHENPLSAPKPESQLNEEETTREDANRSGPSAWTSGIKNVLYMRVNFPDDLTEPISVARALSMMNIASNWFSAVSYRITAFNTTVTPLLTLPRTKSSYQSTGDYIGLLNDARAVAKTNGFDTDNFDLDCAHLVITFPGWGGRAWIGAKGAWLQGDGHVGIACHEFGHNYGLWHANRWDALDDTIIGPGVHVEYGNFWDTMGSNEDNSADDITEYHFNAYEKNLLGWLPNSNVFTVTTNGLYRVHAFDVPSLNSNSFHALRVQKDADRYYWAELRSLFNDNYQWANNGLLLNWSPWQMSGGGTHILDAGNPAPGQSDATVIVGQTFTDPFAGFHLTPLRKNTNTTPVSLDVMVQFGPFPNNRPPTVTVNASATNVAQNAPVNFTATASDPDGDELAYHWEFNDEDSLAPVGQNAPSVTKSWRFRGHYPVRCTVSDMKDGTATALVFMTVGSPPYFTIRGRIEHSGAPVEGVRVSGSPFLPQHGYSDANGNYILGNVPSGTRTLSAVKPGWSFSPANFSNPVTVGASIANMNFSGTPLTYTLGGSVYDSGQVVPGVTVTLGGTNSTVTDANGSYLFPNLLAGVYNLTASKPGYEIRPAYWTNPATVEWQDTFGKDFAAQLAFRLTQMRLTNGGFAFRLIGGSNRVIRIEASTNLVNWATLVTLTNTTGQTDFVDAPFSTPRRFYRAAILP